MSVCQDMMLAASLRNFTCFVRKIATDAAVFKVRLRCIQTELFQDICRRYKSRSRLPSPETLQSYPTRMLRNQASKTGLERCDFQKWLTDGWRCIRLQTAIEDPSMLSINSILLPVETILRTSKSRVFMTFPVLKSSQFITETQNRAMPASWKNSNTFCWFYWPTVYETLLGSMKSPCTEGAQCQKTISELECTCWLQWFHT